jgi:threonylcarbamoyladenosine tRNA methylthiotransferase MtaB
MPHLHLSIQAGDDLVLKRMKRRHGRADALDVCRRARDLRPGIALGADLIAGFPTENEAMFDATLSFVDDAALDYLHVFPYSMRPGTPAARMPQVPAPAIRERATRLRDLGARRLASALTARVGTQATVVAERGAVSHTEHYAPVRLSRPVAPGTIVPVQLTASTGTSLMGDVL